MNDHSARPVSAEPHGDRAETDLVGAIRSEIDSLAAAVPVDRRGFMLGSAGAGFALSVAPVGDLLAQVVKTDSTGLTAGDVSIPVGGTQLPAYRAMPAGKRNLPTILVIQEIFGVHEYIKDVCRRFAKAGYLAIAPELYFRQGDPTRVTAIPELMRDIVAKVPDAQVMSDLDATLAWAAGQGGSASRVGITGFCWGGRITWLYSAHNPRVKAGVAWYGRLVGQASTLTPSHPVDIAANLHGPVLGLYGGEDTGIPVTTINDMKARLEKGNPAARGSTFVLYPRAPHAFHADYRPSYRKEAAADGWQRAVSWFRQHGV